VRVLVQASTSSVPVIFATAQRMLGFKSKLVSTVFNRQLTVALVSVTAARGMLLTENAAPYKLSSTLISTVCVVFICNAWHYSYREGTTE